MAPLSGKMHTLQSSAHRVLLSFKYWSKASENLKNFLLRWGHRSSTIAFASPHQNLKCSLSDTATLSLNFRLTIYQLSLLCKYKLFMYIFISYFKPNFAMQPRLLFHSSAEFFTPILRQLELLVSNQSYKCGPTSQSLMGVSYYPFFNRPPTASYCVLPYTISDFIRSTTSIPLFLFEERN